MSAKTGTDLRSLDLDGPRLVVPTLPVEARHRARADIRYARPFEVLLRVERHRKLGWDVQSRELVGFDRTLVYLTQILVVCALASSERLVLALAELHHPPARAAVLLEGHLGHVVCDHALVRAVALLLHLMH
eukprot:704974-Rhodomonas_salina.2